MTETQTPENQAEFPGYGEDGSSNPYPAGVGEAYPTQESDDETYQINHPENSIPVQVRTFYRSDYGRAARLIQAARHVPGDVYTAKPEAQQDSVSALAVTLATAFEADSDRFDAGKFFNASALPVKPEVQVTDVQLPEDDGYSGDE